MAKLFLKNCWPFANGGAQVVSATAGMEDATITRPVASFAEILKANMNNRVIIQEVGEKSVPYTAKVLEVTGDQIALLETDAGTKVVSLGRIQDITLPEKGVMRLSQPARSPRLVLQIKGAKNGEAEVGHLSVQKGFRWIPNYKVTLSNNDNKGMARIELQATLVNDLTDLSDATVHLVIGVPTFVMKDQVDPIALQDMIAQVTAQENGLMNRNFMNSQMMSNVVSNGSYGFAGAMTGTEGGTKPPTVTGGEKNEDLFLFTVKNITLKKGERMTIPINEVTVPYKDIYTLDILPVSASDGYGNNGRGFGGGGGGFGGGASIPDVMRQQQSPQALHKVRLTNQSNFPLTTAPALIFKNNQVLAQGMMNYTPQGGKHDLTLTTAVDIGVKRSDVETKRTNFVWNGSNLIQVDMKGLIDVTNYRAEPIEIEVSRYISGLIDTADTNGKFSALDVLSGDMLPDWWYSISRDGFHYRDGLGKATWTITVKPQECAKLGYTWHYTRG
jgi:hypothetical protein